MRSSSSSSNGRRAWIGRVVVMLAALLVATTAAGAEPPSAAAALNSPRLQQDCPSGYTYGEHTFGAFVIEGCSTASPTSSRADQRSFRGTLELNGLIVDPVGTEDFKAWTDTTVERDGIRLVINGVAHLRRNAETRLAIPARIAGQDRRFRIYSGTIHLQTTAGLYQYDGVTQPAGTVDIPVNGAAALLGLRLRSSIDDARLSGDTMTLPGVLSLGSGAPALLRDVTGDVSIRLVGGQGMQLTGLEFHVRRFELPGIGGMRNFRVAYNDAADRWRGNVRLELGELFGNREFDFAAEVDAQTGVPTYIRLGVDNMNFPIGQSGIFLQGARAEFGMSPLLVGAGLTATAGPQVAGVALIEMGGDLQLLFEPSFRLDASGTARILPTGSSSQLGTGRVGFVYDADGFVRVSHRQRYEALVLGVGPSAQIDGNGSYATDRNRFNVEASATGRLELGVLGGFDVVRLGAVVSSEGWGTCGSLAPPPWGFLTGGIGQKWDRGMEVLVGCDLSPYTTQVRSLGTKAAARTFDVPAGAATVAVAVRASGPAPTFRLVGPGGVRALVTPTRGVAGPFGRARVAWLGSSASDTTYVFLRLPAAGRWTLVPAAGSPSIVGVRTARSAPPVRATATVTRPASASPGIRRLAVRVTSGLARDERLAVSVVGRTGAIPIGSVAPGGRGLVTSFRERGTGPRTIVGQVVRAGVPLPGRRVVLGRYTATLPTRPAGLVVTRVGRSAVLRITPLLARGAERPDGWSYRVVGLGRNVVLRGSATGSVSVVMPRRGRVVVVATPVVDGRTVRVASLTVVRPRV